MPRQLRVFLCHASQDKPAVRELYNALNGEGWIDPWLDKAKLLPGQDWELVIEQAVDDSDVVIVCLSGRSVSKEGFVQREIRYAYDLALEKPEGMIFLIPLRLDDCPMPRKLRLFHWVDYFGEEKENSYSNLLEALKLRYEQKLGSEEELPQEEPKKDTPEKRFTQKKPYTKILDPALLNPPKTSSVKTKSNYRWYGLAGIFLLLFILGGLGLNSLFNKPSDVTAAPSSQIFTETSEPPSQTAALVTPTLLATQTPSPTATTVLGIGSTSRSLKDGMLLVYVPAGEFTMGSNDGEDDEKPEHQVYLDAFWIDQTEVTNTMYAKCVEVNQCNLPSSKRSVKHSSYFGNPEFGEYPVIYVSWADALAYCLWAGRTLPTEAQWEKAARGTDGRTYPWGNILPKDTLLNYNNIFGDTTRVGLFPDGGSIYGALDMAGNVWEWVGDWYDETYYRISPASNPEGPDSGQFRVLRGGSYYYGDYGIRSSARNPVSPVDANSNIGFRCALSPQK